jgi:iron complex transport system ATP-binding protein
VAARYGEEGLAVRLEARHLDIGYRGHRVGSDVSLALEAGEVLCLLGPNGSGKTTLFKTLLGLLPPQGGQVLIDGMDLQQRKRGEVARRVSYVPQAHAAFFPFTVREVVLMGRTAHLAIFSSPSRHDREIAQTAIERMRLAHLADSIYTRISGGERQLALIARALAQDARIIVMDEPTANLDFGNQVRVMEHIGELASGGMGVLLSTHNPDQAFVCADRVAMLHEGRLARIGPPGEAITSDSLRQLYGVDVVVTQVELGAGGLRSACFPLLPRRPVK